MTAAFESGHMSRVTQDPQQTIGATSSTTKRHRGSIRRTETFISQLGGQREPETLGFCAAGLTETAKRIDQPAIHHFPQLWESLVRL
jgi:hypothetical protein